MQSNLAQMGPGPHRSKSVKGLCHELI